MASKRGRKLRIKTRPWVRALTHPVTKVVLALLLVAFVAGGFVVLHYYNKYARIIDARLTGQIFSRPSILFAAPESIYIGERITPLQIETALEQANYSSAQSSPVGRFQITGQGLLIEPGPESFHSPQAALVQFDQGRIVAITDPRTNQALSGYSLEPEVFTTLFDQNRDKRRLLRYDQIPKPMVEALLAIEDRDFFHHGAFNYWRILGAAYRDLIHGRWRESGAQGASTITQQVARMFFLNNRRTWRRKLAEAMIAVELEQRLTKQQIFELYANDVYMGQRGTYTIRGFGEAARAYFGKQLDELTLPQYALLAGIVQGPNYLTPFRYPKRALGRRNEVIEQMFKAGWINASEREQALATPLQVNPISVEASDAPYFVDMIRDQLVNELPEGALASESFRVYTTLDPELQRAAAKAMADGLKQVDALIARRRTHRVRVGRSWRTVVSPGPVAQAALVALDPHTGAIKALIGGRSYAYSQYNHVTRAERPTGSTFKPFVYAAALNTALTGQQPMITETTEVMDEPTVFEGGYAPHNFENHYYGRIPIRVAIEHSLNNATIALAQQVGYDKVADLAHAAGISSVLATPSEAIGTYPATPLDMAAAWTIFANHGVRMTPRSIVAVETANGAIVDRELPEGKPVLDPRVAFLTTDLLESVMDHGTGVGAREAGFTAPAAGKTGTDHDGWFAGYTSNLLCVVWVGFDNYQDLNLEGARSALPIWAEFMKSAVALPQYANVQPFQPPPGIVEEKVDDQTQEIATALCPLTDDDYFIAGTQPQQTCTLHPVPLTPGTAVGKVLTFLHLRSKPAPPPPNPVGPPPSSSVTVPVANAQAPPRPLPPPVKKKRGFFARLFGIGSGKSAAKPSRPPQP